MPSMLLASCVFWMARWVPEICDFSKLEITNPAGLSDAWLILEPLASFFMALLTELSLRLRMLVSCEEIREAGIFDLHALAASGRPMPRMNYN